MFCFFGVDELLTSKVKCYTSKWFQKGKVDNFKVSTVDLGELKGIILYKSGHNELRVKCYWVRILGPRVPAWVLPVSKNEFYLGF